MYAHTGEKQPIWGSTLSTVSGTEGLGISLTQIRVDHCTVSGVEISFVQIKQNTEINHMLRLREEHPLK